MNPDTPEAIRVAVLGIAVLVASINIGIAAVMRAGNEASRERDD